MFEKIKYINDILHFDGINIFDIVNKYKTPIYIYSKGQIIENYNNYKQAFEKNGFKNFQISFAMKANENLTILKIVKDIGGGVDVVSGGELEKALYVGIDANKVVFSGVGKTAEELELAIQNRIGQINIESYEEFLEIKNIARRLNKVANISIRINPNIEAHTHEKITTGKFENKFGVDIECAEKIIKESINNDIINLRGMSVHIGSQILDLKPFELLFIFLRQLYDKYKNFTTIDLGGGIGIKYNECDSVVSINEYVKLIAKYFNNFCGKIIVEPGRSIVGNAGCFLTKIVRFKETKGKSFLIVDGGMNNLIRPAMYNAFHQPLLAKIDKVCDTKQYDIVGPICETSDVFAKNVELKISNYLEDNENYIVFLCAGAYGNSMASNYNLHNIAGELLIDNGKVIKIKKPISFKDLLKFEEF